jgi:uncharacterized protein (TIGR02118 family)
MIKRTSLVWRRPDVSASEFRKTWLGEHVEYARQLPGLREYVIDFVTESPSDGPDGVATLRFDSRQALDAAFSDTLLSGELTRTREQFARAVQVMLVDEHIVIPCRRPEER